MGSYISKQDFKDVEESFSTIKVIKPTTRYIHMNSNNNGGNPKVPQSSETSTDFKNMWS
jgi:hypothetical protein